jgi:hypothetical protein
MENLSTSWHQVISKILFAWVLMSSCVKPLRSKSKDQGFNLSYVFILFFLYHSFYHFGFLC